MIKMKKTDTCFFCKRIISQHSRHESIECALKLCEKRDFAILSCGDSDSQIKPTTKLQLRSGSD